MPFVYSFENHSLFFKPTTPPTPGKPRIVKFCYRHNIPSVLNDDPFAGIFAVCQLPDGRHFHVIIPISEAEIDERGGMEMVTREYVESVAEEDIHRF